MAAYQDEPAVFPVDEVEGVLRFPASALLPVPSTLTAAATAHARGVLAWRETTIGLLDADEARQMLEHEQRVMQIVNVDDFDPRELGVAHEGEEVGDGREPRRECDDLGARALVDGDGEVGGAIPEACGHAPMLAAPSEPRHARA